MKQTLPAGILDSNIEFFSDQTWAAFCITNGRVIPFNEFNDQLLQSIQDELDQYPEKKAALYRMTGGFDRMAILKQFLICNYGQFDNQPDLVAGKMRPTEYCSCPRRGSCAFEGIVCDGLRTETGLFLSKREVQVIRLIAVGLLDKMIATAVGVAEHTIKAHTRNIRKKTGLLRKADITAFAYKKNLIC